MATQRFPNEASDTVKEQDLERDEIRVLVQAKEKLLEAKGLLEHVQLPKEGMMQDLARNRDEIRRRFIGHFAGALQKLEGEDGAIAKIKAAQAYAHSVVQEAQAAIGKAQRVENQKAAKKQIKRAEAKSEQLQTRIARAQNYLGTLDRRIRSIEEEFVSAINNQKKTCEDDHEFKRSMQYVNSADTYAMKIHSLITLVDQDLAVAKKLFNLEVESERQAAGKTGWRRFLPI